jgi:septation ring formation regulator EzrA
LFASLVAVMGVLSDAHTSLAQNPHGYSFGIRNAASKSLGDDYYFYASETYGLHAYDHADVLGHYAATGKAVPQDVLKEHSDEIHSNIAASKKAYSKLSKDAKDHPEIDKHLKAIEQHHAAASAAAGKLGASKGDPKAVATHAADVQKSLKSAAGEHQQLIKKLNRDKSAN